ncbi:hypothetical protein SBC2_04900 [Caballeronia sp. SBC2]|nr:hypothetical protein SBC2_04900 [Caballeronia sp. SBC2]
MQHLENAHLSLKWVFQDEHRMSLALLALPAVPAVVFLQR